MNKKKNIYEFHRSTHDKLIIRFREDWYEIEYVNFFQELDEDMDPTRAAHHKLCIPIWLLPKLKEGIDMALTEWERECPVKAPEPEEEVPF